jgi:asparagine synthase (glutamine-hydrolysing)
MCGIAGIFKVNGAITVDDVAAVVKMIEAQVHRGPNDWGLLLPKETLGNSQVRSFVASFDPGHILTYEGNTNAPAAVLGTRRLSIIDLSERGRMPMGSADGRVWLTYNGEIYNFRGLRKELQHRGYAFQSETDTEVLLHGYQEWGERVIERLRGMFAFAIFDNRVQDDPKLFLAKDRFGMKPLYWARKNCVFQFASEVRALMAGGLMPNEPEPRGFHGFLTYGSVPSPFTTVRDVFTLPAAHSLGVDRIRYSYPNPVRYWSLPQSGSSTMNVTEAAMEVHRILAESVELHLISDAPLGVFLSGGMDSSTITALAAQRRGTPLTTLSISFDEAEFSEGDFAAKVAQRFGCKHVDVRLRAQDFLEEMPRIIAAMDQPSIDGVNTYFVAKVARAAGLTVALSGLGGDEIFWGYPGFRRGPRLAKWAGWPGARVTSALVSTLGRRFGYDRLEKLEFLKQPGNLGAYLAIRGLFPPSRAARLLDAGLRPLISVAEPTGRSLTPSDYGQLEIDYYLQNQLLRDSDVFGMAHSIEIRLPFLDHRLAEFVSALHESLKRSTTVNKPLLAAAMAEEIEGDILSRNKMGFTFPFEQWMRAGSAEISRYVDSTSPIKECESKAVENAFRKGRVHWSRQWALWVLRGMAQQGRLPTWPQRTGPSRILFLLPEVYASKGGIPVYNQNLLRAVSEAFPTAELHVVSINDWSAPINASTVGRFHFTGCGPRDSRGFKLRFVFKAFGQAFRLKPDLIISGHINVAPLAVVLSMLCKSRSVLIAHGIEALNPIPVLKWAGRRIHLLLAVSRFTATKIADWGVRPQRIKLLPNTVDGEIFRPFRRAPAAKETTLLTVSRLEASEQYKGIDKVINALQEICSRCPCTRYVIVGKGDDLPRLRALAHEVGVADRVDFRGFVPDEALPTLYNEADLFVMPSRMEGFGIVFLEALSCGVPVIAGNRDGSVDAVLDGRVGILVDPQDSRELEQAIQDMIEKKVDGRLLDPSFLREEALTHYGFEWFRQSVRAVLTSV